MIDKYLFALCKGYRAHRHLDQLGPCRPPPSQVKRSHQEKDEELGVYLSQGLIKGQRLQRWGCAVSVVVGLVILGRGSN